jgi:hypothetical protein
MAHGVFDNQNSSTNKDDVQRLRAAPMATAVARDHDR